MKNKVYLVTGAAQRVGATLCRALHESGANVVLHYRSSHKAANIIAEELNTQRENSVALVSGDLSDNNNFEMIVNQAFDCFGQLDGLINNASSFYPTEIGKATFAEWDDLMASNLKAPFFLAQAIAPHLQVTQGCIVNIVDIHASRPLKHYSIYCMAKAGLVMLTKSLAKELGPEVRVNAVAPGAILWPTDMEDEVQQDIISRTALKRKGTPDDIAKTVLFLLNDADYITGQIIAVDGGRTLNL